MWLEIHRPELRDDSASERVFAIGNQVGDVARAIYDDGTGSLVDIDELGFERAFQYSVDLLVASAGPVFEAGFKAGGALAFADVMIPSASGKSWSMIEVKSSTSVKDYHRDDVAVQSYVAKAQGLELDSVKLAHVNNAFVYQGDGDYHGLLAEADLTSEAMSRHAEVEEWITGAQQTVALKDEPEVATGCHCEKPFACPFKAHCFADKEQVEFPLSSLPRIGSSKRDSLESAGYFDLREVPDAHLNDQQRRVKHHSISGEAYFDQQGASACLSGLGFPAYFLDFETIMFGVPIWKGTRPYQQIPYQFSLHRVGGKGETEHTEFLDLTGNDPSERMAQCLVDQCGVSGPVFAYNASFEIRVMRELATRFPDYADGLHAIIDRVLDLLPVARDYYYHPDQHGSWSIKAVLPCACPDLSYGDLVGVADGNMAGDAYLEAIDPGTNAVRKKQIDYQLREYCKLDTWAMVRLWQFFRGV